MMQLFCLLLFYISFCNIYTFGKLPSSDDFAVLRIMEHDEMCFTQGLAMDGSRMYESCGLYGKSSLRMVDSLSGQIMKRKKIDRKYFSEGIVLHNGKIFMLTWKSRTMLVFDSDSLRQIDSLSYMTSNGQGWGITCDGSHFIVSDGSSVLTIFNIPEDGDSELTMTRRVTVIDPITGSAIAKINELQYLDGYVYANVWYRDVILKIDPRSGNIVQKFDMSKLYPHNQRTKRADCLNGIAVDESDKTFVLTGKLWPKYYKTQLHQQTVSLVTETSNDSNRNSRVLVQESKSSSPTIAVCGGGGGGGVCDGEQL